MSADTWDVKTKPDTWDVRPTARTPAARTPATATLFNAVRIRLLLVGL
jgi:hypothetical protein